MKKITTMLLALTLSLSSLYAQDEATKAESTTPESKEKMSGSLVAGATTINGQNYQQIGFRADVPLGKFGFGLDIQLLLDQNGDIREADWDEFSDYLDKIYYLRYGRKGEPFYARVGGLDNSTLGYGIAMNGYSNMLQYPSIKKIGMESSFETETFGGEIVINNFKELLTDKPGMLLGARAFYKVLGDLRVGVGVAMDLNEYNALVDTDGDGYADGIDQYPDNEDLVTKREDLEAKLRAFGKTEEQIKTIIEGMIDINELDRRLKEDLTKHGDLSKSSSVIFADVGYPVVKGEIFNLDLYGQVAKITDYGLGISAPGVVAKMGPLTLKAEYRYSTKEFMFGFYDQSYELERAIFINANSGTDGNDSLVVLTKQDRLKAITDPMNGYFAGLSLDLFGFLTVNGDYQHMTNSKGDIKSLGAALALNPEKIPKLAKAKAYYLQNNVEDFSTWKTPSSVLGYVVGYKISEGVSLDFDYRYNFEDKNGDKKIKGDEETIKTISISTTMLF